MNAITAAAAELDEVMGAIVGCRDVPGLTNNAVFEAFEEQERSQPIECPRLIFAHGQNAHELLNRIHLRIYRTRLLFPISRSSSSCRSPAVTSMVSV